MIGAAQCRGQELVPLAADDALWAQTCARARLALELSVRGAGDPPPAALAIAATAARLNDPEAPALVALLRRVLVRSTVGSESALRCLRALTRAGEQVDLARLAAAVPLSGRAGRMALVAIAEVAAREQGEALKLLIDALSTGLRGESAMLLSQLGCAGSIDALARHLRTPGAAGVHASAALLAFDDDPFAFESLCERLCEPDVAVLAARALWGAQQEGARLLAAESTLSRWARRGVRAAESGRFIAAVVLTAGRVSQDLSATLRAIGSDDDEVVLIGAQAAYCLGDAERARGALLGLFRRGPTVATQAFRLLTQWADLGDARAQVMLRGVLERRPIDLGRAPIFEALAGTSRPALFQLVSRALAAEDRATALEAGRALARLRDPPSLVPPLWL